MQPAVRVVCLALTWMTASACGVPFFSAPPPLGPDGRPLARPAPPKPPSAWPLVSSLPAGLELVAEVDVLQLARWSTSARLSWLGALLPPGRREQLGRLVRGGLPGVELVALGVAPSSEDAGELVAALSGQPSRATVRGWLGAGSSTSRYHGTELFESGADAGALLDEQRAVVGTRGEVRRAVEVHIGDEPGLGRGTTADRGLLDILSQAPRAKVGRTALRAGLRLGPVLRERFVHGGLPPELVERIDSLAVAFAVGDGADVGVVVGARDAVRAAQLVEQFSLALADLKARPVVRQLGLQPFVDDVRMARKDATVHFALRLSHRRLADLLDRIDALIALGQGAEEP